MSEEKKVSRRKYIAYAGAGVVIVAAAAAGGYYASKPPTKPSPATQTITQVVTKTYVSTPTPSPTLPKELPVSEDPIVFDVWPWGTQVIEMNVEDFKKQYDENVKLEIIPGDYNAIMESKLMTKQPMDVCFGFLDAAFRWEKAGWILPVDEDPLFPEMKKDIIPAMIEACQTVDGKFVGLPYGNQTLVIHRNIKMLEKAGYGKDFIPATEEELINVCIELKKKGLSKYPLLLQLGPQDWMRPWLWFAFCHAEGDMLFDKKTLEPTFDVNTPCAHVLESWKTAWDEKLLPEGIFTTLEPDYMAMWMSGEHAYHTFWDQSRQFYNNPETSKIAGSSSIMPTLLGKNKETFTYLGCLYLISNIPRSPGKMKRVWNFGNFLAYKDKNGEFLVPKRYAVSAALFPMYRQLKDDPDIRAAWLKQVVYPEEIDYIFNMYEHMVSPIVYKTFWYLKWMPTLKDEIYNGVTGKKSIKDAITSMRTTADEMWKTYAK